MDKETKPCAYVPVHPRHGRLWANVRAAGAETPVPSYPLDLLYDQATLDAAVVAERERRSPEIERLRDALLIGHTYAECCPTPASPDDRDADCQACIALGPNVGVHRQDPKGRPP